MTTMRQAGFSLIELMIALTLGLISIAAVGSVFIYGSRNYKQDDKVSKMQDNLRFAMAQVAQDVEMAGFFGSIQNPAGNIATAGLAIGSDCAPSGVKWALKFDSAIDVSDNVTSESSARATYPCLQANDFYAGPDGKGTDILGIHRVLGGSVLPVAPPATPNSVLLRTNGSVGTMYLWTGSNTASPAGVEGASRLPPVNGATIDVYYHHPTLWYVSPSAILGTPQINNMNQSIPALCRYTLQAATMTRECLAEGIENLQVEFGQDTDNDGSPNQWISPNSTTPLGQTIAVRISLLARSSDAEAPGIYRNLKSYTMGNVWTTGAAFQPGDGYYRRVLTSTVLLRNPAHLARPYALQ